MANGLLTNHHERQCVEQFIAGTLPTTLFLHKLAHSVDVPGSVADILKAAAQHLRNSGHQSTVAALLASKGAGRDA